MTPWTPSGAHIGYTLQEVDSALLAHTHDPVASVEALHCKYLNGTIRSWECPTQSGWQMTGRYVMSCFTASASTPKRQASRS